MACVPADGRSGTMADYTTRWRLPSGGACEGGCVLQMTYRTANSCVDSCSEVDTTPPATTPSPASARIAARCPPSLGSSTTALSCASPGAAAP